MMILRKKVAYYPLEILKCLCKTKCVKKYQSLQIYDLYVPILDETSYIVKKYTVGRIEWYHVHGRFSEEIRLDA